MDYDSAQETLQHIETVQGNLSLVIELLRIRAKQHDTSKLQSPEKEAFDKWTPKLRATTYGSDEYKAALAFMAEALSHHYRHNSHHPEYYHNGINGMNLIDIIEMLCDWAAATKRHADGDLEKSIQINRERFSIDSQLEIILMNTAKFLGWLK